jgi:hypothetical protein
LANEFLEVPESLATSIWFKSAQVVIATVAFHFFLNKTGWLGEPIGRVTLVIAAFVLSIAMVFGFGLMNTSQSLPPERTALLYPASQLRASEDPFAQFGIGNQLQATPSVAAPQTSVAATELVQMGNAWSWIIAPALVFFVVTAVAALSLQVAESNVQNIVKAGDFKRRRRQEGEWRALRMLESRLNGGETGTGS